MNDSNHTLGHTLENFQPAKSLINALRKHTAQVAGMQLPQSCSTTCSPKAPSRCSAKPLH